MNACHGSELGARGSLLGKLSRDQLRRRCGKRAPRTILVHVTVHPVDCVADAPECVNDNVNDGVGGQVPLTVEPGEVRGGTHEQLRRSACRSGGREPSHPLCVRFPLRLVLSSWDHEKHFVVPQYITSRSIRCQDCRSLALAGTKRRSSSCARVPAWRPSTALGSARERSRIRASLRGSLVTWLSCVPWAVCRNTATKQLISLVAPDTISPLPSRL